MASNIDQNEKAPIVGNFAIDPFYNIIPARTLEKSIIANSKGKHILPNRYYSTLSKVGSLPHSLRALVKGTIGAK